MAQKPVNSWVFLDCETGGLDCTKNAMTSIAMIAIKGDTLEKIDIVNTFVKPYGDYTYEADALKYTGITMNDIGGGVDVHDLVDEMLELLRKADFSPRNKGSKPILVAYNSAFDKGFITQIFEYTKKMGELEKLTYGSKDFYGHYQPEFLDAIHFTKAAFGADSDIPNFKLGTCLEKAGIDLSDAHNAFQDTADMKDMLIKFFGKLRATGEGRGEVAAVNNFRKHFQF